MEDLIAAGPEHQLSTMLEEILITGITERSGRMEEGSLGTEPLAREHSLSDESSQLLKPDKESSSFPEAPKRRPISGSQSFPDSLVAPTGSKAALPPEPRRPPTNAHKLAGPVAEGVQQAEAGEQLLSAD